MRTIRYTNQFKRDYKREKSGKSRQYSASLDNELMSIVRLLAADTSLPENKRDHPLGGEWKDCRDCHISPISF